MQHCTPLSEINFRDTPNGNSKQSAEMFCIYEFSGLCPVRPEYQKEGACAYQLLLYNYRKTAT
jgi:hypothetical protein